MEYYLPLYPALSDAVQSVKAGEVVHVGAPRA
jgi:hypothetical protein